MLRVRVLATPVLAAAAAVAVAACGGSGSTSGRASSSVLPAPTLGQEYPAMKAAVRAATSMEFFGSVLDKGKRERLDLIMTRSGSLSGWVAEGGNRFTVLVTGGNWYYKIDRAFLRAAHVPMAACAAVCGKYVELPRSSARSLTSGLNWNAVVNKAFGTPPTPAQARVRLVPAQYRGQPAWFGRYRNYTVYIARTSQPYLLAVTARKGQVLRFSGWDTASVPGPPPASKLVTPAQL